MMKINDDGFFARVSYRFGRLTDADLITFVTNVLALMALLVAKYPEPIPSLATVKLALDNFINAVQAALNGGKIEIGARKAARAALLSLVRQLGTYVQLHCHESVQNIRETGFEPVKAPSSKTDPDAPANLRLEYTGMNNGELLLKFDPVSNARNYSIQLATTPDGPWEDQDLSTATRVTITDLTAGKTYYVRACTNAAAGSSEWSSVVKATAN
jgi:hypothetical protein